MQQLRLINARRFARHAVGTPRHMPVSVAVFCLSLAFGGTPATAADGVRKILHTKHHTFFIPFSMRELANGDSTGLSQTPQRVELYVSGDQGRNWYPYQSREHHEDRFSFHAGRDGEYWFCVADYDAPEDAGKRPQLKVVVDSEPPEIDFEAQGNAAGQVEITWACADATLDPNTIQLQYRLDPRSQWAPISLEKPEASVNQIELRGTTKWWPPGAPQCEVQAIVQDKSGNSAQKSQQLVLANLATSATSPDAVVPTPHQPPPLASTNTQRPFVPPNQPTSRPPQDRPAAAAPGYPVPPQPSFQPLFQPDNQLHPPRPSPTPMPLGTGGLQPQAMFDPFSVVPGPGQTSPRGAQPPVTGSAPRLTNSRRFHLDYEIEEARDENIDRIEIWWTLDGARQWELLGIDEDRQSPFLVETVGDGTIGFSVLVIPSQGVTRLPPHGGQPADIWIHVDTTPPEGRITSARYGTGVHQGRLQIFWQADDRNLTGRPISLEFSHSPEGPWENIVSGVANIGRYDWIVNQPLPGDIFLRLTIEDAAGNRSASILREPISSYGLAPRGHIQGIRPANHVPSFSPTPAVRR